MNRMPQLQSGNRETKMTTSFTGYNHNEIISDGEMYEMQNLSGRLYPALAPRKKRGITSLDLPGQTSVPLTGIHGRDQLVFVRGSEVYYNFVKVNGLIVSTDPGMLPKKIVSMGAYVCIWPDQVYFNTIDQSDYGSIGQKGGAATGAYQISLCRVDGTVYDMSAVSVGTTAPANPTNGQYWIDQSGDVDVLRQWADSTDEWVEVPTVYVKIWGPGLSGFKEYDGVRVSGLEAPGTYSAKIQEQVKALNGTVIVYGTGTETRNGTTNNYIVTVGILSGTVSSVKAQQVWFERAVPDMDFLCESNNRLWGCKYGMVDGKVVNEIRCCKLGDFKNWECFMGLSTDSFVASIGTDGMFTGAVTYRGYPLFFKENCIHRVSGSMPSSFAVDTELCRGIQNGSWRSAVIVNEVVYYKSRGEIMYYDGSLPISTGDQLGGVKYSNARAGRLGAKYYVSMENENGDWVLMCYDTEHRNWWKEDHSRALGFGTVDDDLFMIDEENNTLVSLAGQVGTLEGDLEWKAVFDLVGVNYGVNAYGRAVRQDVPGHLYLSRFDIRMYLEQGAKARLQIMYDSSGEWELMGEITGSGMKSFLMPIIPRRCDHLRCRLQGTGDMRIYSIARIMEVGSDG